MVKDSVMRGKLGIVIVDESVQTIFLKITDPLVFSARSNDEVG